MSTRRMVLAGVLKKIKEIVDEMSELKMLVKRILQKVFQNDPTKMNHKFCANFRFIAQISMNDMDSFKLCKIWSL